MKKTRNLFVLRGSPKDVDLVLGMLNFKGLTEFSSSTKVTRQLLSKEFSNNKSVICYDIPQELCGSAIEINVINSFDYSLEEGKNYINVLSGCLPQHFKSIADKYDCDIGDHKSNSSGLNGAPSKSDCAYCLFFNKGHSADITGMNRLVYKSENFFVIPTVGQFIKGYLLIIPNEHIMSAAELSSPALFSELIDVLEDLCTIIRLTYPIQNILVWENGTGNGGIGKSKTSIVHSHIHVVPSNLTAERIQELAGFPFTKISYCNLSLYGNHSYLLIKGNTDDEWWINDDPNVYIPRQYVRQLVAEEYGFSGDNWNWRTHPYGNLILSTKRDFSNSLTKNWTSISDRIKANTKDCIL